MQRVLEKMARKLSEYDEASLMQLWHGYAARVRDFEPTKRWEEAALSLCLIQAVHWKNQLFNYHLALSATPAERGELPPLPDFFASRKKEQAQEPDAERPKATVLPFPEKHAAKDESPSGAPAGQDDDTN